MSDFEISPKSVTLGVGQTQQFAALKKDGTPDKTVAWSIHGVGSIDAQEGIYKPPPFLPFASRVVVVAKPAGGGDSATAQIELVSVAFWTQVLGGYLLFCFFALVSLLIFAWSFFCPTCRPDVVRVSPPVVTLSAGQTQAFTANVPVTWGKQLTRSGLYTAPSNVPRTQVTGTDSDSPHAIGSAEVFVSPAGSFSLQPGRATVSAGGSLDFTAMVGASAAGTAPEVEWMSPEIGTLTPTSTPGSLTARFSAAIPGLVRPATVLILARVRGDATRVAGAWVTVLPPSVPPGTCADGCGSDVAALLSLIAIMGALGGIIHGISSFTTYVGNRQFLTSWAWWYVFKPFLSALVALVVFLVFRAGFGGADLSLSGADCLKVAAFAGLIGLFAEPATLKLRDIFDTLFTPRNDPRKDSAKDGGATPLTLTSLDPATVTAGQDPPPSLTLKGTGFSAGCEVRIGTIPRKPTHFSATELVVALGKDEIAKPGKLDVVVINKPPDGEPSSSLTLVIEAGDSGTAPAGDKKNPAPPEGAAAAGAGEEAAPKADPKKEGDAAEPAAEDAEGETSDDAGK